MTNPEYPKPTGIRYERGHHKKPASHETLKRIGAATVIVIVGGLLICRLAEIGDNNQPDQLDPFPSDVYPTQPPRLPDKIAPPDPTDTPRFVQAHNPNSVPLGFINAKTH